LLALNEIKEDEIEEVEEEQVQQRKVINFFKKKSNIKSK